MKSRTLISVLILIMAILIIAGSCATMKKAISDEDFFEVFSGTWVNTEYSGANPRFQKRINYPDGVWEFYRMISDITPREKGKSTIIDKWIDSSGNILYKSHWESKLWVFTDPVEGYEMGKISKSGNTLELLYYFGDYPIEKWEPDNIRYIYWIYYRQ